MKIVNKDIVQLELECREKEKYEYLDLNGAKYLLTLRKQWRKWEVALWKLGVGNKILIQDDGSRTNILKRRCVKFKTYKDAEEYFDYLVKTYKKG